MRKKNAMPGPLKRLWGQIWLPHIKETIEDYWMKILSQNL